MEFKGHDYIAWTKAAAVRRVYIRPKSPTENVLVERFNLTMRQEVLDRYLLTSIAEAGRMLEDWRVRYNLSRPHHSLGGLSPLQYAVLAKSS
ncbi:integrase core domain-containing protein [Pseudoxanthomonas sacheonensis]|uniref:integrase core domain-containing protein n=1 Tax=Pseudoxanthomonas sacheonensis TaxID=443615 RepID=UPI0013D40849